jgi:hypothetical protein
MEPSDYFDVPTYKILRRLIEGIIRKGGTIDHCGRGARTKKARPLYIHSFNVRIAKIAELVARIVK